MHNTDLTLSALLTKNPDGEARIKGDAKHPDHAGDMPALMNSGKDSLPLIIRCLLMYSSAQGTVT